MHFTVRLSTIAVILLSSSAQAQLRNVDYNIRSSNEQSYQTLLASGDGQAFDPISTPGTWHDSSSFKIVHSQAPAVSPLGLVGGGVDDRFDFQLVTGEFLDSEGLSYLSGSYHTFGNNGTHSLDDDISSGNGASPSIMAALETYLAVGVLSSLPGFPYPAMGTISRYGRRRIAHNGFGINRVHRPRSVDLAQRRPDYRDKRRGVANLSLERRERRQENEKNSDALDIEGATCCCNRQDSISGAISRYIQMGNPG